MLPMHDTTDIADRLRALADDLENADADDDLPTFHGYDMVEEIGLYFGLDVYLDESGDVWFANGGELIDHDGPDFLNTKELRHILDAAESVSG